MKICFITSNDKKFEEMQSIFPFKLTRIECEITEIQGTKEEIIRDKIEKASLIYPNSIIVVDDVSVEMHGINNFPGPYFKQFRTIGMDKIMKIADTFGESCDIICLIAVYFPFDVQLSRYHFFKGETCGNILLKNVDSVPIPRFEHIFVPYGSNSTLAMLSTEEDRRIGYRFVTAKKLIRFFIDNINVFVDENPEFGALLKTSFNEYD